LDKRVFLDAPAVGELEKEYLAKALDSGFVSTLGPFVTLFEEKFAQYVGVKYAIAVQSGTAAIHVALYELGIGRGDEVIVPSLTFVATVNPILYVGAKPVIVDVDRNTWNILPEAVENAITENTKAIIPVHIYGNPCDMNSLKRIWGKYKVYLIEDAAESLGATYDGNQTGSFGDLGCFSFNGNKVLTTGGGGMIVTNNKKRAEHIKYIVNQARDDPGTFYHSEMGFNYRMTNIEAALGLAQMSKLDGFLNKKRVFKQIYHEILSCLPGVKFQQEYSGALSSNWLTCIEIDGGIEINVLGDELRRRNIESRRLFGPIGEINYLKGFSGKCPNSVDIYEKGLCLASSTVNTVDDIKKTALEIRDVLTAGEGC